MAREVKSAVILAAGMGTRLRSIIGEKPKGLLKINGKELILHSIEKLNQNGIRDILLVTGYKEEYYIEYLQHEYPEVRFITNQDYAITGSMHSLFLAKDWINSEFLLLESDLYYEKRALTCLINSPKSEAVLVSGKTGSGDEVYVYGNGEQIEWISKQKTAEKTLNGELVGISKISLRLYREMCRYYVGNIAFPSDFHYEDCFSKLSQQRCLESIKIDDLAWTEIDDASHYERALVSVVPKVLENEQKIP